MKTPLFVTGTGEGVGKTLVTLGLVSDLLNNYDGVGFIKPLGIAKVRAGRDALDVDAMLLERACSLHSNIKDMCPVTLSPTTWPEASPSDSEKMLARMQAAFDKVSSGREFMVVEGTGHAALGSGLGLSNARVAKMLGAKVLLVGSYGTMGRNPFDIAAMNKAVFEAHGVDVIGLVINRVPGDLIDSYGDYASSRLGALGIPLRGLIPETPALKSFRFLEVSQVLEGRMLHGGTQAEQWIHRVRVGAMTPRRALTYLEPGSLIITPGDREDMIVSICAASKRPQGGPAGLVLSAGEEPAPSLVALLEEFNIPTYLAQEDSYTVAGKIHDMHLRIQPTDEEKISVAQSLVMTHVDLDGVVSAL